MGNGSPLREMRSWVRSALRILTDGQDSVQHALGKVAAVHPDDLKREMIKAKVDGGKASSRADEIARVAALARQRSADLAETLDYLSVLTWSLIQEMEDLR